MIVEENTLFPFSRENANIPTRPSDYTDDKWSTFALYLNPIRVLRALEQINKFRSLDDAALRDAGLSSEDVDRATLGDFIKTRQNN